MTGLDANTGRPAFKRPSKSHCDNGPASRPIRTRCQVGSLRTSMRSSGWLETFSSRQIPPTSSTMHREVSSQRRPFRHNASCCASFLMLMVVCDQTTFYHYSKRSTPPAIPNRLKMRRQAEYPIYGPDYLNSTPLEELRYVIFAVVSVGLLPGLQGIFSRFTRGAASPFVCNRPRFLKHHEQEH